MHDKRNSEHILLRYMGKEPKIQVTQNLEMLWPRGDFSAR